MTPTSAVRYLANQIFHSPHASEPHKFFESPDPFAQTEEAICQFHTSHGFHSWAAAIFLNHHIQIENWPSSIREAYFINEFRNSIYQSEYAKLSKILNEQNHKWILLKGLWMQEHALPYSGLRVYGDADIWVDEQAFQKIDNMMAECGFVTRDRLHHRFHFHKEFRKTVSGHQIIFEIHKELTLNSYLTIPHKNIWHEAIMAARHDSGCMELKPEHNLVYVFCHSVIHGYDRLSRVLDLPLVFDWAIRKNMKPQELHATLKEWRCQKMFLFAWMTLKWLLAEAQCDARDQSFLSVISNYNDAAYALNKSDISQVQSLFDHWQNRLDHSPLHSLRIPRHLLADNFWYALRGALYPRRLIGSLIDRAGFY